MPHPWKLTFDLLTWKVVSESRVTWATFVPILVFLGLSVLDLGPMYATDIHNCTSSLNAPYTGAGALIIFFFVVRVLIGGFGKWLRPILVAPDIAFPQLNNKRPWLLFPSNFPLTLTAFVDKGVRNHFDPMQSTSITFTQRKCQRCQLLKIKNPNDYTWVRSAPYWHLEITYLLMIIVLIV